MSITKDEIVRASIAILNREGIGGLSMRTIARELGIKAASLYNHISGKAELYHEIAEHICQGYADPDASLEPKEYLIAAAAAYRAILLGVRDAHVIFGESFPATPRWIAIIKAATERFLQFGVSKKNLLTVASLYNNYILSFIADETRTQNRSPEEVQLSEDVLGFGELLTLHGTNYDEQFLFGLDVMFAGLEAVAHTM